MSDKHSDFCTAVQAYLDIVTASSTGDPRRAIADHFECALTTVERWARGTARPHPRMQKQILKWIEEQT